jgi:hypothetical protein
MAIGLSKTVATRQGIGTHRDTETVDLFEMANLFPRTTGLPMTVWVSPRGRARHDARIKVCLTPGPRMDVTNTAVVGLAPRPRLIKARLPGPDFDLVVRWITLNEAVLLDFRNGAIDTVEPAGRLRKVDAEAVP